VAPSALPKCSRCKSWGKLSSDKCTFCGKPFDSSDYGGGSGSDKKDTPVLEGPSHPTISALPKCTRCGSIGKLSSDKCTFCSKPYTDEDFGGKAQSKPTEKLSGPSSTHVSDLPKCNRCGSKGTASSSKCAFCGFPYGEAFTGGSTTSTSTPSTYSTPSTSTTYLDTSTGDTTSSGSGSSSPAFCGCCGSPAEGGAFCGVCGEPF
jgi:ribosomal protein L37E